MVIKSYDVGHSSLRLLSSSWLKRSNCTRFSSQLLFGYNPCDLSLHAPILSESPFMCQSVRPVAIGLIVGRCGTPKMDLSDRKKKDFMNLTFTLLTLLQNCKISILYLFFSFWLKAELLADLGMVGPTLCTPWLSTDLHSVKAKNNVYSCQIYDANIFKIYIINLLVYQKLC